MNKYCPSPSNREPATGVGEFFILMTRFETVETTLRLLFINFLSQYGMESVLRRHLPLISFDMKAILYCLCNLWVSTHIPYAKRARKIYIKALESTTNYFARDILTRRSTIGVVYLLWFPLVMSKWVLTHHTLCRFSRGTKIETMPDQRHGVSQA